MKNPAALLLGLLFASGLFAQNPDALLGVWKTGEGTAHISIFKNKNTFQGKIVWLKEPNDPKTGKPKVDSQHPDAATKTRPLLGMSNLWGFSYDENSKKWKGGFIYDPKNGKTYDCVITMKNDKELSVRGFVMGMTFLGRSDTWVKL